MLSLFGILALYLALFFALLQSILPCWGYWQQNPHLLAFARPAAFGQFIYVLLAYFFLTIAFVNNDFSIIYVAANSHPYLPIIYRLTALWGGHEGSILLWVLLLNIWTIFLCFVAKHKDFAKGCDNKTLALALAILGVISFSFLCFLIFSSNPFSIADEIQKAKDLNPLLQDPGFIIHPPMLYMGYVGFSITFAITEAALIRGKLDAAWAQLTRHFAIGAWCFLTLGITLGSWWSYHVLGWGGFWFWDPVENASLLPWLAGIAFIHILILVEKRSLAIGWCSLLAIFSFGLSLLGTFLVRSGILVSVHTFANDPTRGIFLLLLFFILMLLALSIYIFYLPQATKKPNISSWFSREMFLLMNSALLFIAMLTILLGTLYPLILDALQLGRISVGAPYFNLVMLPQVVLILALMVLASLVEQKNRGMMLAHLGFAILILGVILSGLFTQEKEMRIKIGQAVNIAAYRFYFVDTHHIQGPNYRGIGATFDVFKNKRHITSMHPEKRIYPVREMVMSKVAIHPSIFRDLYLALGEPFDAQEWSIRLYYKPFIRWIWFGAFLMIIGGVLSIWQRTKRIP